MATRGASLSVQRKALIEGLEKVGGSIKTSKPGGLKPEEVMEALGLTDMDPKVYSGFMARAATAGIIRRKINGRQTKAIYLVHGKKRGERTEPVKRQRRNAPVKSLPLPALTSSLDVFMLSEQDGTISIGLRNETGSWMVDVKGYAATV